MITLGYQKNQQSGGRKLSRSGLIKKMDTLVREITFLKESQCCCCHKSPGRFHPKTNPYGLQPGHYISRTVWSLRWDLRNVHAQCSVCNRNHENDILPYTLWMIKNLGEDVLQEFEVIVQNYRQRAKTYTTPELRDIFDKLTEVYARLSK